jgi:hypothetical protein
MIDTYLYGRGLYQNMTAFWPTADENSAAPQQKIEYARIWKNTPIRRRAIKIPAWGAEGGLMSS